MQPDSDSVACLWVLFPLLGCLVWPQWEKMCLLTCARMGDTKGRTLLSEEKGTGEGEIIMGGGDREGNSE